MAVRAALGIAALTLLAGCSGSSHAKAQAKPSLTIPAPPPPTPTRPARPAHPGSRCGHVTTVNGKPAQVTIVKGHTTCAIALHILTTYNDPDTPAEGTAGLAVIDHWTCQTHSADVATCTLKAATIRSRP